MRTKQSIRNISIGILSQLIIILLGFVSRKVFIDSLGVDYLGIDGLLTNVLSVVALIESGIGASIVYNLYKPLAEKNQKKVIALVQIYKKAYSILALIILFISLFLYPFLGYLMKDASAISNLTLIYSIFVLKNIIAFLNAHKWSLINADQRGYVIARMNLLFQVLTTSAKIIILLITQNYILYLIVELVIFLFQNIINGRIVIKRYPYIKTKVKYPLDLETKENLVKNVKALFLHNIGGYLVFGTDNILISSFIGLATVGIYANYTMIVNQLAALIKPVLEGIGASVGNLIATEGTDKNFQIFNVSFFINFWIYSIAVIFLYELLEPFIAWWIGKDFLLEKMAFMLVLINFYLLGMRTTISTFKNKAGLFTQDKYMPVVEGLINLVASLILVRYFGLAGIFLGTTISTLTTVFWIQPVIVYKYLFKASSNKYFIKYIIYLLITILAGVLTSICTSLIVVGSGLLLLIIKGIICLLIPNLLYILLFHRTFEFQYVMKILLNVLKAKRI